MTSKQQSDLPKSLRIAEITSHSQFDHGDLAFDINFKSGDSRKDLFTSGKLGGVQDALEMSLTNGDTPEKMDDETLGMMFLSKITIKSLDLTMPIKWLTGGKTPEQSETQYTMLMNRCEANFSETNADSKAICGPYARVFSGKAEVIKLHAHPKNPVALLEILQAAGSGDNELKADLVQRLEFSVGN